MVYDVHRNTLQHQGRENKWMALLTLLMALSVLVPAALLMVAYGR